MKFYFFGYWIKIDWKWNKKSRSPSIKYEKKEYEEIYDPVKEIEEI